MKAKLLFLIGFFACQTIFGQNIPGISVQGIARDAERAAIVDELLTFTFEITDPSKGLSHYKENVTIKTDPYGVFSHIIGTGNSQNDKKFNEIPFGQAHMNLLITVSYDNNIVEISNGPFQYAPYAKSAENGVPTGTIVAFAGQEANVPKGWVLCDGRTLTTIPDSGNLVELIGNNVPDLRGMFLRGTGTSPVNGQDGPALGETQEDAFKQHEIYGATSVDGNHNHQLHIDTGAGGSGLYTLTINADNVYAPAGGPGNIAPATTSSGNHDHKLNGESVGGDDETRPVNYGVNYIIKL